eukprot:SM000090S24281  [mRNA]  locus=s90:47767:49695:+ [translate_table: standard]
MNHVQPRLVRSLDNVRAYLAAAAGRRPNEAVQTTLLVRFGRLLFYTSEEYRERLQTMGPFPAYRLEQELRACGAGGRNSGRGHGRSGQQPLFPTLETSLPADFFARLRTLALSEAGAVVEREDRYVIQLEDATRPDRCLLKLVCGLDDGGSGASLSGSSGASRLTLQQVKVEPLRHMVVDVACVGCDSDLRLSLRTELVLEHILDNERAAMEAIVAGAVPDASALGGLAWPSDFGVDYGGAGTSAGDGATVGRGPFTVRGVRRHQGCRIVSAARTWQLQEVSGAELRAGTGRLTFEAEVAARSWASIFQLAKEGPPGRRLMEAPPLGSVAAAVAAAAAAAEEERTHERQLVEAVDELPVLMDWLWHNAL